MRHIIILGLACLSMTNLCAYAYSYGMTEYEKRSLQNQEQMLEQQRHDRYAPGQRQLMRGTTRVG